MSLTKLDLAEVVIVDHQDVDEISEYLDDETLLLSEDSSTSGKTEFNLIDDGKVATQLGTGVISPDDTVVDCREKTGDFADWVSGLA